jgi:hypothetical protein
MLITAAEVAMSLSASPTDANLVRVVTATDAWAKRSLGRQFERATYDFRPVAYGGDHPVWLRESPIRELIEVRVDRFGKFGADTIVDHSELSFNTDPFSDDNRLRYLSGCFPEGSNTVRVQLIAGWWPADDATHACDLPADLRELLIERAAIKYRESGDTIGEEMQSTGSGDRNWSKFEQTDSRILKALRHYKR